MSSTGLRQSLACSCEGNHEELQHQRQPYPSHQKPLGQGHYSAIIFNSSIGDWFRTTVGVRQGCLLSFTLLNISLEMIMTEALQNHKGTVSIGDITITSLRFAETWMA